MTQKNLKIKNNKDIEKTKDNDFQFYIDFLEEIYSLMDKNYYKPVSRNIFELFLKNFKEKIFSQLKGESKSIDYIKWRSAAYLVDELKSQEDVFSAFYPPKPAKEYADTALGIRIDLGIEGKLNEKGYLTTQVEPRSDAYSKGLRKGDVLLEIDQNPIINYSEDEIIELLTPLVNSVVSIKYMTAKENTEKIISVVSKEYFKQSVFMVPVKTPGVYCLQIKRFNRKTSDDLFRFLRIITAQKNVKGLILDLRDNPGGPPLAAREISSFFLPAGQPFTYFQKKGMLKAVLDVPNLPDEYHYHGPLVILINKQSGSASELFSGILQKKGRAVLMGTNSAGQVMLKSMFDLADKSMLLLITARGHYPDGSVFSFDGLMPDKKFEVDESVDLIDYASRFFLYLENRNKNL